MKRILNLSTTSFWGNFQILIGVLCAGFGLEINKRYRELDKIDPSAFVVMSKINDTRGGMIKKSQL